MLILFAPVKRIISMSYTQYTSPPGGPPTSTTYPYGTYPYPAPRLGAYGHPPIPGAYPYQPTAYQTGVTSYGWPYPYSYVSHLPQPVHAQRPGTQTPGSITAHTHSPSVPPTTAPPRPSTFTSYARESAAAAGPGGVGGRGSRKQSTVKGLFTKECETRKTCALCCDPTNSLFPSKKPDVWVRRRSQSGDGFRECHGRDSGGVYY